MARRAEARASGRRLERETGIEPATNSLEGCDSTTNYSRLRAHTRTLVRASARQARRSSPVLSASYPAPLLAPPQPHHLGLPSRSLFAARSLRARRGRGEGWVAEEGLEPSSGRGREVSVAAFGPLRYLASCLCWNACVRCGFAIRDSRPDASRWSWRRDSDDRLITNQLLYRTDVSEYKRGTLARPVPRTQPLALCQRPDL